MGRASFRGHYIEKDDWLSSIDKTAAVTAEIRNCNNISSGKVSWEKGKLNIKYGLNGTGKTTIGKAVIASSKDDESKKPSVILSEDVGEVALNEDFDSLFEYLLLL